jgi:hypothetical protein
VSPACWRPRCVGRDPARAGASLSAELASVLPVAMCSARVGSRVWGLGTGGSVAGSAFLGGGGRSVWRGVQPARTRRNDQQPTASTAGIEGSLLGVTPVLAGQARWREIEAWMVDHDIGPEAVVIVDDGYDMGPLTARFVRCSPLTGLDDEAATAIVGLFKPAT